MKDNTKSLNTNIMDRFLESKFSIYVIFIVVTIIVLPNLNRESLWLDELYSATISLNNGSLKMLFSKYLFLDPNPPMYYVLLHFWSNIFGESDFAVRLLSYVCIIISFLMTYKLLVKYFSNRIAIIYVLICSFTPGIIYYAQEARYYALLFGLANVLSVLFIIFIKKIKENSEIEKSLYLYYLVLGITICYTHFFGYFFIFSIFTITFLYSVFYNRKSNSNYFFLVSFIIGAVSIIWLLVNSDIILSKANGNFWVQNNLIRNLINVVYFMIGSTFRLFGFAAFGVISLFFLLKYIKVVKNYFYSLFPVILLLFITFIISINSPIITPRNLIVILPLILIFMTFVINEIYSKNKLLILLYVCYLFTITTYESYTYKKQDWKGASNYLKENFSDSNCVIPTKNRLYASSYYLGAGFNYSTSGPKVQENCDLIYFDGHLREEKIVEILKANNINVSYKILNFNNVFVVIKN